MVDLLSVLLALVSALSAGSTPASVVERGTATWYCGSTANCTRGYGPSDLIAAIDRKDSRFDPGDVVVVRHAGRSVTVRIVDTCACAGSRIIDLSRGAFARLANPGEGVISVTLSARSRPVDSRPVPIAPPTDVS